MTNPDYSQDHFAFSGLEEVCLVQRVGNADELQQVPRALRRPVSTLYRTAGQAAVQTQAVTVKFHLPAADLAGKCPRPGDRLIDKDGIHWRIESVKQCTLGTRHEVTCRRQAGA